jgi:hypothetical protein
VKFVVLIVAIGLLFIPAGYFGLRTLQISVDMEVDTPHLTTTIDHSYGTSDGGEYRYKTTGEFADVLTTYEVSCGSTLNPTAPQYTVMSVQKESYPVDQDYWFPSASAATANVLKSPQAIDSFAQSASQVRADCHSQIVTGRWETFFWSPVGWLVILFVLVMFLGAMAGGGSGEIHGSLSRNFFGGWTLRLWK